VQGQGKGNRGKYLRCVCDENYFGAEGRSGKTPEIVSTIGRESIEKQMHPNGGQKIGTGRTLAPKNKFKEWGMAFPETRGAMAVKGNSIEGVPRRPNEMVKPLGGIVSSRTILAGRSKK